MATTPRFILSACIAAVLGVGSPLATAAPRLEANLSASVAEAVGGKTFAAGSGHALNVGGVHLGLQAAALGVVVESLGATLTAQQAAELREGLELARQALDPARTEVDRQALGSRAVVLLREPASEGQVEALWHLGNLYASGIGVPQTSSQALSLIGQAANANHPAAAYWMAAYYQSIHEQGRDGVFNQPVPDRIRATAHAQRLRFLTFAALGGHVGAMEELAAHYSSGSPAVWPEAGRFWRETAQAHRGTLRPVEEVPDWVGSPSHQAQPQIAQAQPLVPVRPVPEPERLDDERPQHHHQHQHHHHSHHHHHHHTEPSASTLSLGALQARLDEAERRIARLENERVASQMRIASLKNPYEFLSEHGALPPMSPEDDLNRRALDLYEGRNYTMAAILFEQAAEKGSVSAQANLGLMYLRGTGVEQDTREAIKRLRVSARAGNVVASENLGLIYANGLGGKVDRRQARTWFELALAQGSEIAANALIRLSARD